MGAKGQRNICLCLKSPRGDGGQMPDLGPSWPLKNSALESRAARAINICPKGRIDLSYVKTLLLSSGSEMCGKFQKHRFMFVLPVGCSYLASGFNKKIFADGKM